jgi:hypothetical protein
MADDLMTSTFHEAFTRSMSCAQRMHLVMTQADYIQKEDKEGMKYKIVSHDKVTALLRPLTVAAGLVYYPLGGSMVNKRDGNLTESQFVVRFQSIDNADDFVDVATFGYGVDTQDKGPGKAISYGVKYALLKAFGLETGDDPDLEQGDKSNRRSSLEQRADTLRNQYDRAADELELREILTSASTGEIMAALRDRAPADAQSCTAALRKAAARVGFDLAAYTAEQRAKST